MTQFSINEYVWDRLRDGPGIVVGISEILELPYSVAEITPDGKKLGRVGYRKDEGLCRYVKLIVPEDEAQLILSTTVGASERAGPEELVAETLNGRVAEALVNRGIEPQ